MTKILDSLVHDFMNVFKGNDKAHGYQNSSGTFSSRKPPTFELYKKHLEGSYSLAIYPIIPPGISYYGALDFDNHEEKSGVDIIGLSKKIHELGLPLVCCRSKSGGAHVYIFGAEKLNTVKLNKALKMYAVMLKGFGELDIEIFPKQVRLIGTSVGNHLSIPYLNALETNKYALVDGEIYNVLQFIEHVKNIRVSNEELDSIVSNSRDTSEEEAPPCIQALLKRRLPSGGRNKALYNYAVYAKKSKGDEWRNKVIEFNANQFETPLSTDECKTVITSVTSKHYAYSCSEEPIKSLCDRKLCIKRKYGIDNVQKNILDVSELPELSNLKKYTTVPVLWDLDVDNKTIRLTTDQLMDFRLFRKRIMEELTRVIGTVKAIEWDTVINKLTKEAETIDIPEEATRNGQIRGMFSDFCNKVDLTDSGKDLEKRKRILSGKPQIYADKHKRRYIAFKTDTFANYVRDPSRRMGNISRSDIYLAIHELGVFKACIKIAKATVNVYMVSVDEPFLSVDRSAVSDITFEVPY